jgi:hypothetical protein
LSNRRYASAGAGTRRYGKAYGTHNPETNKGGGGVHSRMHTQATQTEAGTTKAHQFKILHPITTSRCETSHGKILMITIPPYRQQTSVSLPAKKTEQQTKSVVLARCSSFLTDHAEPGTGVAAVAQRVLQGRRQAAIPGAAPAVASWHLLRLNKVNPLVQPKLPPSQC